MVVELVGAADQVLAAFEGLVDDHGKSIAQRRVIVGEADRSEISGGAVEELLELRGLHGAQVGGPDRAQELGFVHLVVAAQERGHAVPRRPAYRSCRA